MRKNFIIGTAIIGALVILGTTDIKADGVLATQEPTALIKQQTTTKQKTVLRQVETTIEKNDEVTGNTDETTTVKKEETTNKSDETTTKPEETTKKEEGTTKSEEAKGGWIKNGNGYKYYFADGRCAKYGFFLDGGRKYFVDANGYKKTGIITYNKKKYYVENDGRLYAGTGIVKYGKNKYYVENGELKKGLKKVNKVYYYFNKKSYKMTKNKLVKVKGIYYKFNKSGKGTKKSKGSTAAINLMNKITNSKDSKQTKLRKGFNYMTKKYSYKIKPGYFVPKGKNWVDSFGYNMIKTKSGRCYSYAAAFCLYAREVGYKAEVVVGRVSGGLPHAWCQVKHSGKWYIYDVDLAKENNNISSYYKKPYSSFYKKK